MATEEHAWRRVESLVDEGLIYYGQTDASMRRALERAAREWTIMVPADFVGGRSGEWMRRPWGEGPNESIDEMLSMARVIVSGLDMPSEEQAQYPRSLLEQAQALQAQCGRASGSPYAFGDRDLVRYLWACRSAGVDLPSGDSKYWPVDSWEEFCRAGMAGPQSAKLAAALEWFRRYNRYREHSGLAPLPPYVDTEPAQLAAEVRDVPPKRWRHYVLARAVFGSAEAAREICRHCPRLRDAIERCELSEALLVSAGGTP